MAIEKRILSLLMIVAMAITMVPMFGVEAYAGAFPPGYYYDGNVIKYNDSLNFDPIENSCYTTSAGIVTLSAMFLSPGGLYITKNCRVELANNITVSGIIIPGDVSVVIDLNGHVLNATGNVSTIENYGNLTITDSSTDKPDRPVHYYTVSSSGIWVWNDKNTSDVNGNTYSLDTIKAVPSLITEGAVIAISGGSITGGKDSAGNGGGIYNVGNIIINNCAVIGNESRVNDTTGDTAVDAYGGIKNDNDSKAAELTMSSVTVAGNLAICSGTDDENCACGGIMNLEDSISYIDDCYIVGNIASAPQSGYAIGGIANADAPITINNSSISGNIVNSGTVQIGGIFSVSSMIFSGVINLSENAVSGGLVQSNVYLFDGQYIDTNGLSDESNIGITTEVAPTSTETVQLTTASNYDYSRYFTSDNSDYAVANTGSGSDQVVKLCVHEHAWTYSVDSNDTATLNASCITTESGICNYHTSPDTLTIEKPAHTTYGDGKNANATIKDNKTTLGALTSLPDIKYQKKDVATWTDLPAAPTDAGTYKASITVDTNKTAYVEYTIAKKQLTVTGTEVYGKGYDGTTSASVMMGTTSGAVGSDDVTVKISSAAFADKNAGANKAATVKYTISGADAANYLPPADDSNLTAIIAPRSLSIDGTTADDKTYDGTTVATVTAGSLTGVITGDVVTVSAIGTFADANAGTSKEVTITYTVGGTDAGNYSVPQNGQTTATITPKAINVSADNKTSCVGSSLAALTYTADDLCNGDSFSGELSSNANKDLVGNAYTITQGSLTAGDNYTINFTAGTYTVSNNPQTAPSAKEGYTIDFVKETLKAKDGYELSITNTTMTALVDDKLTPGAIYYVRLKAKTNYDASSWTAITVPARPAAPALTGTNETIENKKDAKLSGVTAAMEYSTDSGITWIAGSGADIANPNNLEIRLRTKATDTAFAGEIQTITFPASTTKIAVTIGESVQKVAYGEQLTRPTSPEKSGYTFGGWFKDTACTDAWDFDNDTVTEAVTLYAKWTRNQLRDAGTTDFVIATEYDMAGTTTTIRVDGDSGVKAGGLEALAKSVKALATDEDVKIVLEVRSEEETSVPAIVKDAIKNGNTERTFDFLEIDLKKYIGDPASTPPTEITDTAIYLVEVIIPYTEAGKTGTKLYRYHGGSAAELTRDDDKKGAENTFYVDEQGLHLFSKLFSTYAISYLKDSIIVPPSQPIYSYLIDDYKVSVATAKNGTVAASKSGAYAGDTVTLTVTPDKGWELETLTVTTGSGKEIELSAVTVGEKYTFKMPLGNVKVSATFMEDNTMLNYFVDIKASDYYYDAVLWAAQTGVTDGVDDSHFAPWSITSRAQMVTFLWRAAGSPQPTTKVCPFTDIEEGTFYYKAVLWAYENGITDGTSLTEFSPNATVTRGQAVTFLWRTAKASKGAYTHSFTDVPANQYYSDAVAWAYAKKITDGTSATTFSPADECLRGQVVTFLYKYFAK